MPAEDICQKVKSTPAEALPPPAVFNGSASPRPAPPLSQGAGLDPRLSGSPAALPEGTCPELLQAWRWGGRLGCWGTRGPGGSASPREESSPVLSAGVQVDPRSLFRMHILWAGAWRQTSLRPILQGPRAQACPRRQKAAVHQAGGYPPSGSWQMVKPGGEQRWRRLTSGARKSRHGRVSWLSWVLWDA